MPDSLAGLCDEFEWELAQRNAWETPQAARLRMAGVKIIELAFPPDMPEPLYPGAPRTYMEGRSYVCAGVPLAPARIHREGSRALVRDSKRFRVLMK